MKKGRHYKEEEIKVLSQSIIGKTFREIQDANLMTVKETKITKGGLGAIIEQDLFGIEANQESAPDFVDAGIELKVTPYKRNKDNSLSAKERLVLNIIDYKTEYKNEFKKWAVIQSYKYPELSAIQIFELAGFDRKIISSKNARDRLNCWKRKYKNIKLESNDNSNNNKLDKQNNIVLVRLLSKTEDLLSILNKKL